jgi:hypothetical protein
MIFEVFVALSKAFAAPSPQHITVLVQPGQQQLAQIPAQQTTPSLN